MLLVVVLTCLSVMIIMSVWRQRRLLRKMPPGPTPLPFIGNFLELDTEKFYDCLSKVVPGREMGEFDKWCLGVRGGSVRQKPDQVRMWT